MMKEISLRIVLQNPVEGNLYGLQKGRGPDYEIVHAQLGNGEDLTFDFTVQLKEVSGSLPALAGPFVQGPAGNRFIYIGIGSYAGQNEAMCSGRLKVPLPETAFQNIQSEEANSFWSCRVPGRTENGKPMFATVKPFTGWLMGRLSDKTDE